MAGATVNVAKAEMVSGGIMGVGALGILGAGKNRVEGSSENCLYFRCKTSVLNNFAVDDNLSKLMSKSSLVQSFAHDFGDCKTFETKILNTPDLLFT